MVDIAVIIAGVSLLLVLCLAIWLWLTRRQLQAVQDLAKHEQQKLEAQILERQNQLRVFENETVALRVRIEEQAKGHQKELDSLEQTRQKLESTLKGLCQDALQDNAQNFFRIAQESFGKLHDQAKTDLATRQQAISASLEPIKHALGDFDRKVTEVEKERNSSFAALKEQMSQVLKAEQALSSETSQLKQALVTPQVRGSWGEMQLRRAVELSGMVPHCDFLEQVTTRVDGEVSRPDMLIKLPDEKVVIVDAKTPLESFLKALAAEVDSDQATFFQHHARHVRGHIDALAKREYWQKFANSPEFVVLFLPGETFLASALRYDPELLDYGAGKSVLLVTPTTLIALLRSVAFGWRQDRLSKEAAAISKVGHELHKRIGDLGKHWARLGRYLDVSVKTYNQATATLESRVLPSARKFEKLHAATVKQPLTEGQLPMVEDQTRQLSAPELLS